jgi:K+-sensing histidine kinase KdpD
VARLYTRNCKARSDRASEVEAERRSEQVKAALLDALTHNLRTPLTAIKASVTALIGDDSTSVAPTLSAEGQRELPRGHRRGIEPAEPVHRRPLGGRRRRCSP